jgi:hypothetical protein
MVAVRNPRHFKLLTERKGYYTTSRWPDNAFCMLSSGNMFVDFPTACLIVYVMLLQGEVVYHPCQLNVILSC